MRTSTSLLIVLGSLALAPALASAHGGGIHSANVEDAHHIPEIPTAGQPVSIHLYVNDDSKVESVRAVYCRVQRYACAPALLMEETSPRIYDGLIKWDKNNADFFRGVTKVGYKFEILYVDGTNETTPLSHYPARPPDLPPGGDTYYYYTLQPAPESPGLSPSMVLAIVLVALAWRNPR